VYGERTIVLGQHEGDEVDADGSLLASDSYRHSSRRSRARCCCWCTVDSRQGICDSGAEKTVANGDHDCERWYSKKKLDNAAEGTRRGDRVILYLRSHRIHCRLSIHYQGAGSEGQQHTLPMSQQTRTKAWSGNSSWGPGQPSTTSLIRTRHAARPRPQFETCRICIMNHAGCQCLETGTAIPHPADPIKIPHLNHALW